jgi:hypothetical protein
LFWLQCVNAFCFFLLTKVSTYNSSLFRPSLPWEIEIKIKNGEAGRLTAVYPNHDYYGEDN